VRRLDGTLHNRPETRDRPRPVEPWSVSHAKRANGSLLGLSAGLIRKTAVLSETAAPRLCQWQPTPRAALPIGSGGGPRYRVGLPRRSRRSPRGRRGTRSDRRTESLTATRSMALPLRCGLTKWSSAASVASPLQRRVRLASPETTNLPWPALTTRALSSGPRALMLTQLNEWSRLQSLKQEEWKSAGRPPRWPAELVGPSVKRFRPSCSDAVARRWRRGRFAIQSGTLGTTQGGNKAVRPRIW